MMACFKCYLDPLSLHQKKMSELDSLWQNILDPRMKLVLKHICRAWPKPCTAFQLCIWEARMRGALFTPTQLPYAISTKIS